MTRRRWVLVGAAAAVGAGLVAYVLGLADEDGLPVAPAKLADDHGAIGVSVPGAWDDVLTSPVVHEGDIMLPRIEAAPDRGAYRAGRGPGMELVLAPTGVSQADFDALTVEVANRLGADQRCEGARQETDRRDTPRLATIYTRCTPAGTDVYVVVQQVTDSRSVLVLAIQGGSEAERELILTSFALVG